MNPLTPGALYHTPWGGVYIILDVDGQYACVALVDSEDDAPALTFPMWRIHTLNFDEMLWNPNEK